MDRGKTIRLISFGLFLLVWSSLSLFINDSEILPSPLAVITKMFALWQDGKLLPNLWATLVRVFWAFTFAMSLGALLGFLMGRFPKVNDWLDPWLLIFLNLPALVVIVLCYLWIGLNETAAILAVTLNKIPLVTTIIREGARNLSPALRDLGTVFRISAFGRWRHILLPELYPYLVAAARAGLSVIWKIVLVVEFLGRSDGIGRQIHLQFSLFNITGVLAYSFSFIACVLMIEFLVLRPLELRATRWRGQDA